MNAIKKIGGLLLVLVTLAFAGNALAGTKVVPCTVYGDIVEQCTIEDNGDGTATAIDVTNSNPNANTNDNSNQVVIEGQTFQIGAPSVSLANLVGPISNTNTADSSIKDSGNGTASANGINSMSSDYNSKILSLSYQEAQTAVPKFATQKTQMRRGFTMDFSTTETDPEAIKALKEQSEAKHKHDTEIAERNQAVLEKQAPERTRNIYMRDAKELANAGKQGTAYQGQGPDTRKSSDRYLDAQYNSTALLIENDPVVRQARVSSMVDDHMLPREVATAIAERQHQDDLRKAALETAKLSHNLQIMVADTKTPECKPLALKLAAKLAQANEAGVDSRLLKMQLENTKNSLDPQTCGANEKIMLVDNDSECFKKVSGMSSDDILPFVEKCENLSYSKGQEYLFGTPKS